MTIHSVRSRKIAKPSFRREGFTKPKKFVTMQKKIILLQLLRAGQPDAIRQEGGMGSFVDFQNVKKIYRMGEMEISALKGASFQIEEGEFCVIVGASGAGKTTILNILGGMDTLTEGHVMIDGQDISKYNNRRLTTYRRLDVGFVFQFYNLVQNLTAIENVELAAQICKNPLDARTVIEQVGLSGRADNFPAQLSGGEQQRVAIARALVNNPKMIIADEPTGNLDPGRSLEIMMLLEKINELGTTMLVVTHEKELVNRFSKRVIAIENGRIISDETGGYYKNEEII